VVRDLERTCREMYMLVQGVHQQNGLNSSLFFIYMTFTSEAI